MWHKKGKERNSLTRDRCRCELSLMERVGRNVLKWFGHVKRMEEKKKVKRAYWAVMEGNRSEGGEMKGKSH